MLTDDTAVSDVLVVAEVVLAEVEELAENVGVEATVAVDVSVRELVWSTNQKAYYYAFS